MNSFALACACACSLAALLSLGLRVFKFGKYLRFDSARATFWEDLRPALNMPDAVNSLPDRATIATPSGHPNKKGKKGKMPTGRLPGARVKDAEYDKDVGQISRINKVIFVHVPKTGGSTIEQSKLFYDAKKHHPVGGHTHAEKMRNLAPGFRSFSMVRHPCERFISAFTYTLTRAPEPELAWHHKNIGSRNVTAYVASSDFGGDVFWKFLHFRPQHSFLFFHNGTFGVDLLMCQDNWTKSMQRLREYMKPTVILPFHKRARSTTHSKCSDLPKETRQRIERAYAMDMCLFYPTDAPTACSGVSANEMTARYQTCKSRVSGQKGVEPQTCPGPPRGCW
ncbi:unnamed protein product [Symbiodinium natans]|uniref:Sulfotransferase domain-containing protein n=1 Tax=Symbiodinium natans TaxID=878477 RepID=A0A812J744_9DINO|nr:unnamed protein product [Symbiodinium natans]